MRRFIADASHELRTPMAALRSNIQIFLDAHRLPANERAGLQQAILDELDELTQLVADVVELARGATPNEHTEPIALDEIANEPAMTTSAARVSTSASNPRMRAIVSSYVARLSPT